MKFNFLCKSVFWCEEEKKYKEEYRIFEVDNPTNLCKAAEEFYGRENFVDIKETEFLSETIVTELKKRIKKNKNNRGIV